MNLENYQERFSVIAESLPDHEDLKRSFRFYTMWLMTRNIKMLYAACSVLDNIKKLPLKRERSELDKHAKRVILT